MKNRKPEWFAIVGRKCAYARDVYPEEINAHRAEFKRMGNAVLGPFKTREKAEIVARENLAKPPT